MNSVCLKYVNKREVAMQYIQLQSVVCLIYPILLTKVVYCLSTSSFTYLGATEFILVFY